MELKSVWYKDFKLVQIKRGKWAVFRNGRGEPVMFGTKKQCMAAVDVYERGPF